MSTVCALCLVRCTFCRNNGIYVVSVSNVQCARIQRSWVCMYAAAAAAAAVASARTRFHTHNSVRIVFIIFGYCSAIPFVIHFSVDRWHFMANVWMPYATCERLNAADFVSQCQCLLMVFLDFNAISLCEQACVRCSVLSAHWESIVRCCAFQYVQIHHRTHSLSLALCFYFILVIFCCFIIYICIYSKNVTFIHQNLPTAHTQFADILLWFCYNAILSDIQRYNACYCSPCTCEIPSRHEQPRFCRFSAPYHSMA